MSGAEFYRPDHSESSVSGSFTTRQNLMLNILILADFLAAAILLVYLSRRFRYIKSTPLRWLGRGLTGVLALLSFLVCGAAVAGLYKEHMRTAPLPELHVDGGAEQVKRGQAIADSFCAGCHSPNGTLTGGEEVGKHLPINLGSFVSSNLTPAGALNHWSDGQIFRAIRNAVDANGRWLVIMSITNAGKLSDEDTHALIAYLRKMPAAGEATPEPPDHFNFLGLAMLGLGQFPSGKPVDTGVVTGPLKAPTIQYGEYILSFQDCRECHGKDLSGGVAGQLPPIGPGLSLVASWSRDEFIATMRTGKDPGGHEIGKEMPWRPIGKMDDIELTALYEYLTHMPGSQATRTN
jgi:mono/diheme cytochrome c family protein